MERVSQSILELNGTDACKYFLRAESYCTVELPPYIKFDGLISDVHRLLSEKALDGLSESPSEYNGVNYTIFNNRDGKYVWRPLQLIHPALYVSLVHTITQENNWKTIQEKFEEFASNQNIVCRSLPIILPSEDKKSKGGQILHWWRQIEQASIELSLDYRYLLKADITDCYGSIYTHSIAWALHSKKTAKKEKNKSELLGNKIDNHIKDMSCGQTNGIPQGSLLMDFIAEIVLGFADLELSKKIKEAKIAKYHILRYRDDYRIFVNNLQDGEQILKLLTEVAIQLGLKLNPTKIKTSSDIINFSVKEDKLHWLYRKQMDKKLQKYILIIYDHAMHFPNSGSLVKALNDFYEKSLYGYTQEKLEETKQTEQIKPLIAVIVDIAYRNPKTYPICAAILSKLINLLKTPEDKIEIVKKIKSRFNCIPNTGYMEIWLQRITYFFAKDINYKEKICRLLKSKPIKLWNCDWISCKKLKDKIINNQIINKEELAKLGQVIPPKEVNLFNSTY